MPKAILELEMPESCKQCKLGHYDELYGITHCDILRECMPYEGRRSDCPLKLADGDCRKAEWVNGKCRGFQVSRWDDEPIEKCKNCKDFEEYKGVEQE
jgi:hypothetical protein